MANVNLLQQFFMLACMLLCERIMLYLGVMSGFFQINPLAFSPIGFDVWILRVARG